MVKGGNSMSRASIALLLIIAAVGAVLAGCGPGANPTTTTSTTNTTTVATTATTTTTSSGTTTAVDARGIYAANCAACHGANRQGVQGIGPALTPASLASRSLDQVKETIASGRPNTAMTGFKGRLTSEQIEAVAQYIKNATP